MIIFWTVLAALAVYRASRMIASEDGPFEIFSQFQAWAGGNKTWIGRGLGCVLCISFWLAIPFTLLLPIADWREFVLLWLSVAAGVVILHRTFG